MPALAKTSFAQLKSGMRVRILAAHPDCPECERLMEMGLTEGVEFAVVKVAPLGDPIEIDLRGYRLCLRKSETSCFEIEIVK
ncbi:MAG: FeoA domain-containing protein [Fimbriimonas ginsengisoli]|uniref:FeoA domain-containing protein n=1 Tax=Fimbriimonas ginsengisoli TaxID=1005039 RepID=A0A931LSE8_FIMGI|nr:FeoA domain-containing protein [Fimbriimonas ginsengisoli]MBI3721978.1 FeoA domain-containing protein [Fimbriimonas ginsengisoli]